MPTFNLSILTPNGIVYENDVQALVAPGASGAFGVLANHAPMIAATLPGVFKVKEDSEIFFAVGEGMLEVSDGNVNFLADFAERADSPEDAKRKSQDLRASSKSLAG